MTKNFIFSTLIFCAIVLFAQGFTQKTFAEDYYNDFIVKNNDRQIQLQQNLEAKGQEINKLKIVKKDNKYGVSNKGKVIIPAIYDAIEPSNYCFIVKKDNLIGCISGKGEIIVPVNFDKIKFTSEYSSYIVVYKNGKAGLYKYDGTLIYNPVYKNIQEYSSIAFIPDFILEKTNGKFDLVIFTPAPVKVVEDADFIPTKYSDFIDKTISTFIYDLEMQPKSIAIKKNGKWGVITYAEHNGKILSSTEFIYDYISGYPNEDLSDFRDQPKAFFLKKDGKWELMIAYPQKIVKTPQYDNVNRITASVYLVSEGNKYGLVDLYRMSETGVIYDEITKDNTGYIKLKKDKKTKKIDPYITNEDVFKKF